MSVFSKVSSHGLHPWEDLADHPPFAEQLMSLVDVLAPALRFDEVFCRLTYR